MKSILTRRYKKSPYSKMYKKSVVDRTTRPEWLTPWRRTSCPGQQGRLPRRDPRHLHLARTPRTGPSQNRIKVGAAARINSNGAKNAPEELYFKVHEDLANGNALPGKFSKSLLESLPRNSTEITMLCKMHLMHVMFYWVAIVFLSIFQRI